MTRSHRLVKEKAGLLVIDYQVRLASAMDQEFLQDSLNNTRRLVEGAQALEMPVWVTEQYPKGLGATLPFVSDALPEGWKAFEKVEFSCAEVPALMEAIRVSGRTQLIVCGMETHICVFQTARDLADDFEVFVPADAVLSRSEVNDGIGLALIEREGALVTSTETVLFDLVEKAGTPAFKTISALVK